MTNLRFGVIGAGVIGAAVARQVLLEFPGSEVVVYDKAKHPAAHQTGHNSGVVHAGLYYEPGSLKARLCRRGVQLISDYAAEKGIAYDQCGKIVVALEEVEEARLKNIFERAKANGVPGVRLIGPGEIRELEPNAVGRMALHSPKTAIISYPEVTKNLILDIKRGGGKLILQSEVERIEQSNSSVSISTKSSTRQFDYVIVCAGLQSDRLGKLAGGDEFPRIVPFFGQYLRLEQQYESITNGLIYPVPDPDYPFLGVHLTKRVDGAMMVGPNAFFSMGRENYTGWDVNLKDTLSAVSDAGFWKFAAGNIPAAIRELAGVVSHQRFIKGAARYVPAVAGAKFRPLPRGVRAQAMDKDGALVDDFVIEYLDNVTVIRNAPSPGATSSLAIAEHLVNEVKRHHNLA